MRKATLAINGILILALAGGGYYAYTQINPATAAAPVRTVTAAIGTVTSSVAASGKVTSPGDIGLVFPNNGTVTSVNVQVGQKVKRGQLLATIDSTAATNALAQAQLSYRKSLLSVTSAAENVATAEANLATAKTTAQSNLDAANQSLASTQAILASNASQYQLTMDQAQSAVVTAQQNFDIWNNNYQLSIPLCSVDTPPTGCSSWVSAYNNLQSAQRSYDSAVVTNKANILRDAQTLQSAQTAVTNAQTSTAVTSAEAALKSAQDAYAALKPGTTSATSETDSQVAQLQVQVAQKNLAATRLVAPAAGTVAAVAGKVGDMSSSTSAGGINGFIILTDVSAFQVQAGFSEADSAKVRTNARAAFTFDALPNATAEGTVISIAPLPVTANSVNTYTVTFALNSSVSGLKPGMTANATLIVGSKSNVLAVPDTALTTRGGRTTVTVLAAGVQKRVSVTVGLKGDSETEITSGLKSGDVLVLPSATTTSGFPSGGVPGSGSFGGGLTSGAVRVGG
ncbi:macrolide export protein MacA [mine drainage metagenome]|uniref:Macrolide export protein MacA n=1 Tax=mine drainage metagenome TaxID=410659 RepID=A0A1J5QA05_9ZZZZ